MNYELKDMCTCGHSKWEHAIGLKGDIGGCMKETYVGWEWCKCDKFVSMEDSAKNAHTEKEKK